jgi:hypothetical protein
MLLDTARMIAKAEQEGLLVNGHTWGAKVHAVVVDDAEADVGKRKRAICGRPVVVATGNPMIGCATCQRMIATARAAVA